jgi:hypothetical protein
MALFFFAVAIWLIAWGIFLLSALAGETRRRTRPHTLFDSIQVEL